jgi:hypothetical protein
MQNEINEAFFEETGKLLQRKKIKDFRGIFYHLPYDAVAAKMKISKAKFMNILASPEILKLPQVIELARILHFDSLKMLQLVGKTIHEDKDRMRHKP